MPICPKCETEYRDGFDTCFDCQVELVESIKRPASLDTVEEKYVEDMFETPEEEIRFCLNCFVEFVPEAEICPPCGDLRLQTTPRSVYDGILKRSPLAPHQEIDTDEIPRGLRRVFVTHSPADAGFACSSLAGMGVDAVMGRDGLDDLEDDSQIGIWVAEEDVEACAMILPEDPNEWRDDEELDSLADPYDSLMRTANQYVEISKEQHGIALCTQAMELDANRPEAFFTLGRIVGGQGHVAQACESFRAAVERIERGAASPAAWFFVVFGFLTDDLGVSFTGPKADEAMALLKTYSEQNPRNMEALRLLLEAAFARGEKANVKDARRRITDLNKWVLEAEGPHQAMTFE